VRFFSEWLEAQGREPVLEELTRPAIREWLAQLNEIHEPSTVRTRSARSARGGVVGVVVGQPRRLKHSTPGTDPRPLTKDRPTLTFGHPAPNPPLESAIEGFGQALHLDGATSTDLLRAILRGTSDEHVICSIAASREERPVSRGPVRAKGEHLSSPADAGRGQFAGVPLQAHPGARVPCHCDPSGQRPASARIAASIQEAQGGCDLRAARAAHRGCRRVDGRGLRREMDLRGGTARDGAAAVRLVVPHEGFSLSVNPTRGSPTPVR
jgi:hypothetical protein